MAGIRGERVFDIVDGGEAFFLLGGREKVDHAVEGDAGYVVVSDGPSSFTTPFLDVSQRSEGLL